CEGICIFKTAGGYEIPETPDENHGKRNYGSCETSRETEDNQLIQQQFHSRAAHWPPFRVFREHRYNTICENTGCHFGCSVCGRRAPGDCTCARCRAARSRS